MKSPPIPPQRFIYVIGPLAGLQKIGLTMDPKARLATLQTASPEHLALHVALRVPFGEAFDIEARAHGMLRRLRVAGEWFETTPAAAIAVVLEAAHVGGSAAARVPVIPLSAGSAESLPLFAFRPRNRRLGA